MGNAQLPKHIPVNNDWNADDHERVPEHDIDYGLVNTTRADSNEHKLPSLAYAQAPGLRLAGGGSWSLQKGSVLWHKQVRMLVEEMRHFRGLARRPGSKPLYYWAAIRGKGNPLKQEAWEAYYFIRKFGPADPDKALQTWINFVTQRINRKAPAWWTANASQPGAPEYGRASEALVAFMNSGTGGLVGAKSKAYTYYIYAELAVQKCFLKPGSAGTRKLVEDGMMAAIFGSHRKWAMDGT